MKKLFLAFALLLCLSAGAYNNPIISGFHPDPSICRVGNDYYLVNSTFEYMPGVPIFHSKDLVNWTQIGNVLTRKSQNNLTNARPSDGIYAPTLRYHNGTFYMITTLCDNGKRTNFYVTTQDIRGEWSDPIVVDQDGIDPSILFDEDGKVYFQSNRGLTFNMERAIYQSEIDIRTGKRLTEPRQIWKGTGGCYIEGPHLYKINGYYYLLTAEGGTMYGHMVTIARSTSPWGPFISCPHNPVLSNRHAYEQIHGTGHADLIQAHDGSWWAVHLAFRTPQVLGRETCLVPVSWDNNGWPHFGTNGTNSTTVDRNPSFYNPKNNPQQLMVNSRNDFDSERMGVEWLYLRNPDMQDYSLVERKGFLRLKGNPFSLFDLASPAFTGRRQEHWAFEFSTVLDFSPRSDNEEAGLTVLMTNRFHYRFRIVRKNGKRFLQACYDLEDVKGVSGETELKNGSVSLSARGDKKCYYFLYSQGGQPMKEIGRTNTTFLSAETTGGYNGVILGMYASGNGKKSMANADFDYIEYIGK